MSFQDFQELVNAARDASEAKRVELKLAQQKASNLKRKKDRIARQTTASDRSRDERLTAMSRDEVDFAVAVSAGKAAYTEALTEEWARLNEYLQFTNPIANVSSLEDNWPILLFPLRLETRFKKIQRRGETIDQLWVRVFPDDIAIDSFESDLSETEIRNARSYWLARWRTGLENVAGHRGAWRSLASAHGSGRAYWLTKNYIPVNVSGPHERTDGEIILAIGTEDALAEPELTVISDYWEALWRADKDSARLAQAWSTLLETVSEERATQLIEDYKPFNINDTPPEGFTREATDVRVELVIFPKTEELETKLHAWSQPPTTSILPERFVFLAFQDGELAMEPQLSNLIPPRLVLGPDPAAEQGEDFRLATKEDADADSNIREGDLIVSDNMRWMFDFDEAVAKGMGFKIDLTSEQASQGFDRVLVIGVKLSADKDKGQSWLEGLFAQHQSSRKGLAIIKQGTPTNNTEDDGSGYSWRHDPDDSFKVYFDESVPRSDPVDWYNKRDGRWLAELLGIDPSILQSVENYYGMDICEAKAMQRALWPATMGHFMDSMMSPVFSKRVIEQTREFFTRYVSGRGILPAIRVGKQPYGILPATDYTHMEWVKHRRSPNNLLTAFIAGAENNFLANLYRILLDIDESWMDLHHRAAYVGKEGDAHQILLDIVGLHPDSVEVYTRYANSLKQIHNIYSAKGAAYSAPVRTFPTLSRLTSLQWPSIQGSLSDFYPTSYEAAAALLAKYGYTINAENPEPDIFKKAFFKDSYLLSGDRIDKVPNSEVNPIGEYTPEPNPKNYIGWLIEAAETSHDRLRLQEGFIDDKPPTALLYLLLHHALDLSYIDASLKLHLGRGVMTQNQVQKAYIEPDFIHIEENNETESRWKYLYKSDERITGDPGMMVGQYIAQHLDTLYEADAFKDVLAGLRQLEDVPTARLERALMEHIDTVSYRYDAWILGYLHLQLEHMRGLHEQNSDHENLPICGIFIGAYGWLEELHPENKILTPPDLDASELNEIFNSKGDLVEDASNAGYILAPSQNHAVTAAVLRNGHLSNDDPENKEELKIKLTSQRVRLALQIIEGIQGGQTLSALLGYQFERGLHDRTDAEVDQFVLDLRNAFPLVAKKLKETAPGAQDTEYESIDQIEAKNVIDGLAFLEHIEETGLRTYPFGLTLPPTETQEQADAINQEALKLIEINDAVADLALAESVHQVVLGNYERAAATLDTYSKGNFPPTPDVIQTPRSGTQLTHRVALQFRSGLSYNLNVLGVTPRMVSEPAIHDWLTQIMPGLDDMVCVVHYTDRVTSTITEKQVSLNDIGLAHIDVLYLLDIDRDQAMSALDDLIIHFVLTDLASTNPDHLPRMDEAINIEYTHKLDASKFTIFEMSSLIASLRALLLRSKPLNAADVRRPNEAAKEHQQTLSLDPNRIQPVISALSDIRTSSLANYVASLSAIIAASNVDGIVTELDTLMSDIAEIFTQVSRFGIPQSGTGFIYQWHQSIYTELLAKVKELIARWEVRRTEYLTLRADYMTGIGTLNEEDLFNIVMKAEFKISSTSTASQWNTGDYVDYFNDVDGRKFVDFEDMLNNTITPVRDIHELSSLIDTVQTVAAQLPPFDLVSIDIEEQLKQVEIFAGDLLACAENLSHEMRAREVKAEDLLASAEAAGEPVTKVELVKGAAKAIFGDDFITVPEFSLDTLQGTEWQNTLLDSDHSLRYLLNDLDIDFPLDDWLYGISRVREKLYYLENILFHIEGLSGTTFRLVPSQFPYHEDDYWLGLQFPDKRPKYVFSVGVEFVGELDTGGPVSATLRAEFQAHGESPGSNAEITMEQAGSRWTIVDASTVYRIERENQTLSVYRAVPIIDEDKLLFTSIYTEAFDPTHLQCGLLLDEWTEVIPSRNETLGLAFHYDQPNSEPPQALLLVTPSDFTGHWRWEDLVNTLHATLDMARKRAVEPDHVDTTVYSRFLPPIVSLASPIRVTAILNLVLNNPVFFAKMVNDD